VLAFPYIVPARFSLNTKLPVYVSTPRPERSTANPRFCASTKTPPFLSCGAPFGKWRAAISRRRNPFAELVDARAPALPDASGNFGMGDAIALQHGADQFGFSVNNGKRVPLETALVKFEPAGLPVTHGVRHSPFIQIAT